MQTLVKWIIVGSLFHCALPSVKAMAVPANDTYVVMGGFRSCRAQGSVSTPNAMLMLDNFRSMFGGANGQGAGDPQNFVYSCLDLYSQTLKFVSSLNPTIREIPFTPNRNPSLWLGPLMLEAKRVADRSRTQVHVIGHSYGGWLAAQVALNLPEDVRVKSLTTIDPISPIGCAALPFALVNATQTVSTIQQSLVPSLGQVIPSPSANELPGCVQAPTDIIPGQQDRILQRLRAENGSWENFYQEQHAPLHSGPFLRLAGDEANENGSRNLRLRELPGPNQHRSILGSRVIWNSLLNRIGAVPAVPMTSGDGAVHDRARSRQVPLLHDVTF